MEQMQAAWFESNGGQCSSVRIGASEFGRGLFAAAPISAGDRIIEVPNKLMLTGNKLPRELSSLIPTGCDWLPLALLLIVEKYKGQESAWAPYIACLPSAEELQSTIFWKDEELAHLECTRAARGTQERRQMLLEEFSAVSEVIEAYPRYFGNDISLDHFLHSYATVVSRAWNVAAPNDVAMRPFVDFCNHSPEHETIISLDAENDTTIVVADRDYSSGDQVYISYGRRSNAVLAVDYGFTMSSNPFDEAELWMVIPYKDPLRRTKLRLLADYNMPTLQNADGSESGELPVIIEEAEDGTGLCQARSFARIICADSSEDLKEMIQESASSETPLAYIARRNAFKEARAMSFLSDLIDDNLGQHERALMTLQNTSMQRVRGEMARAVLAGELRVLMNAKEWMKQECAK